MKIDSKKSSSIWVLITRIVTVFFSIVYSILSKYFLGDNATSLIGSSAIVNSYNRYVDIAVEPIVSGITRRTPEYLEENKTEELKCLTNSSFTLSMIIALIACIINLILGVFSDNDFTKMLFFTMAFGSVFKVMNRFISVQKSAVMQLVLLSRITTSTLIFTYLFSIFLIYSFGVIGFYISTFLITSLSGIILYSYFGFNKYSFQIDYTILKESLLYSLPMLIFGFSEIFIFTLDKIILGNLIKIERLGVYNFSFQSSQILFGLVISYFGSMYSYYVVDFNKFNTREKIFSFFNNEISKLLIFLSFFIIGLLVFFELITKYVLTDFINGLPTLYLFTTISIMFTSHYLFYVYLLVLKENLVLIKISLISIVISSILFFTLYFHEGSIFSFAILVVVLYFMRSFILVTIGSKSINNNKLIILFITRVFSFSLIPFFYFLISYIKLSNDFLTTIFLKIIICGLVLFINIFLLEKGQEMLSEMVKIIKKNIDCFK
jgi:O-antigen/teichoic acid export membrane protein